MKKIQIVFCLTDGVTTCISFDLQDLSSRIEMELDNLHEDDLKNINFTITTKEMTSEEIDNLPEFEGF